MDGIEVRIVRRRMRHLRLSVLSPDGQVRLSAPPRVSLEALRTFAAERIEWIKKHRERLRALADLPDPEETGPQSPSVLVFGERVPVRIATAARRQRLERTPEALILHLRPEADGKAREGLLDRYRREILKREAEALFRKWESLMSVRVGSLSLRKMKTRWGTCNTRTRAIRLNTELTKQPHACLEYVVVHEMVHLLEASHNRRFQMLMTQYLPDWRERRRALNQRPGGVGGKSC